MGIGGFVVVVLAVSASVPLAMIFGRPLVMGKNGYSLSKVQLLLWTAVVAISYLLYLWKLQSQESPNFSIAASDNLLLLLGFSAGSFVTAAGIRGYQDQKAASGLRSAVGARRWRTLVCDYSGNLDLSKIQMLVWTVVALSAYIVQLIHALPRMDYLHPALPDVSGMLVALMGISQATYLGRKALSESGGASACPTAGGSPSAASASALPPSAAPPSASPSTTP